MQIFLQSIAAFGVAIGLVIFIQDSLVPASGPIAVAPATTSSVDIVGTLTYYPNNVGIEVPYIVYRLPGGATAKALVFGSDSTCNTARGKYPCGLIRNALPAYYDGSFVRAKGVVQYENLFVDTLDVSETM